MSVVRAKSSLILRKAVIPKCGETRCRAYLLTLREFERLGGERWQHGFKVRLGKRVSGLYRDIYKGEPKQVRSSRMRGYTGKIGKYPCGILEQAYRELMATEAADSIAVCEGKRVSDRTS